MKLIALLLLSTSLVHISFGQSYWSDIKEENISTNEARTIIPDTYRTFTLDIKLLNDFLEQMEAEKNEGIVSIPLPDGETAQFKVQKVSNFHPQLAQKYPQIHSYLGLGVNNRSNRIRISITPNSFHGIVMYEGEEIYIDPYTENNNQHFISYYTKSYQVSEEILDNYRNSHAAQHMEDGKIKMEELFGEENFGGKNSPFNKNKATKVVKRKYRLALACTGDYAQRKGGTVARVLEAYNIALDRVNFVLESEVGVNLELIANNDTLIFLDPESDPYISSQVLDVFAANVNVLNRFVGVDAYDIGHAFTTRCSGGTLGVSGGVGIVCRDAVKGRAASCETSATDRFYIGTLCHEIGHQLNALHTWNNCPNFNDDTNNYNPSSAYEPGGGVTIMSYNLACGNQNYGEEFYYHTNSIESIIGYVTEGVGTTCGTSLTTNNDYPEVEIDLDDNFFIPISTPFELTATAEDINRDELTYCWEQYDLDPIFSDLGNPQGNDPSFRSFPPTTSPTRTFPRMNTIINNRNDATEVLPTYNRDLTFRCTVRDNNEEAGGVAWDVVKFRADASSGPFLVTFPTEQSLELEAGSLQEIRWDVANTNNNRVNCQFVNIKMSLNGGQTFPHTLIANTPNDGSVFLNIPDTLSNSVRIRIEAANNIFFDISNHNFRIVPPSQPGYTLILREGYEQICLPDIVAIPVETGSIRGFQDTIELSIVDGLPEGAIAEQRKVVPGTTINFSIDLTNVNFDGQTNLVLQAVTSTLDTTYRDFQLDIVNNDFSSLQTLSPNSNSTGIVLNTEFTWTGIENANTYNFQLSDSPTFENIINETTGLRDTFITPDGVVLEESTLFFWRIQPVNECGAGAYTVPNVFQTVNVSCVSFEQNEEVLISGSGTPTVESTINIDQSGTITDLNVPVVVGGYQPIRFVEISLLSPQNTQVILFNDLCGGTSDFNLGFDDEAPDPILCPPTAGVVQQPVGSLADFIGEDIMGEWKLRFRIKEAGFGGGGNINNWQLESCADIAVSAPYLVTNDTFVLPPATRSQIWVETLEAQDDDNTYDEISYVLLSVPQHGMLFKDDLPLNVGDSFTQQDIEGFSLSYEHDGSEARADAFNFILQDTDGGWFGVPQFNIVISEDGTVDTEDFLETTALKIYPNPTQEILNIEPLDATLQIQEVRIFDTQGKLVRIDQSGNTQITVSELPVGIYSLLVQTNQGISREKIVIVE